MSYQNLKAEMRREGVTQRAVAQHLGMTVQNFGLKINGLVTMTVPEIKDIRDTFLPDATLDYLCETTENKSQ